VLFFVLGREILICIDERLDIVEAFVNDSSIRTFISQDFLGRVPDFERLVRKFIRKKANLEVNNKIFLLNIVFFRLGLL
jgi:DNA mismatch repair protein MSH2